LAHIAEPSSDTSTTDGSPVRSRLSSAAATPKAMFMAPVLSPNPGSVGGSRTPSGSSESRMPPRPKNTAES
jgi:hypothetical protein